MSQSAEMDLITASFVSAQKALLRNEANRKTPSRIIADRGDTTQRRVNV